MGLTFNNIHSSVYGLGAKIIRPLLPGNSDNYIDIPGRAGSILFPSKPKDKLIPVEFGFMPTSKELFRTKVWDIAAWLYTDDRKILIFDDEPNKSYLGKIEGQIDLEQVFVLGKFTAVFRCYPYAFGTEVTTNFVNDSVTIFNTGTVETEPYFQTTLTDTVTEWKITFETNYCRVVHTFKIGDVLTLDFATGAILLNGNRAVNLLDWQNSRFFTLPVGKSILTTMPAGKSVTMMKYTPKWR